MSLFKTAQRISLVSDVAEVAVVPAMDAVGALAAQQITEKIVEGVVEGLAPDRPRKKRKPRDIDFDGGRSIEF